MRLVRPTILCLWILLIVTVAAQTSQPRRTACLQWDQAYNQIVILGMAGAAIGSVVFWLGAAFLFGRHAWWAASPRARVWIMALFSGTVAELLVVVWPRLLGFGRALFSAIDPQYVDCQTTPFGAPGLLYGVIGQGVNAYSQWPAITGLVYGAALVGGVVAWLISEAIVKSSGLQTMAQGAQL
jgi:hypothetical protein